MSTKTHPVTKLSDRLVITAFETVLQAEAAHKPHLVFRAIEMDANEDLLAQIKEVDGYSLDTATLTVSGCTCRWTRSDSSAPPDVARFDQLSVTVNKAGNAAIAAVAVRVQAALTKALQRPLLEVAPEGAIPFVKHQELLAALEGAVAQALVYTTETRKDLEAEFQERQRIARNEAASDRERLLAEAQAERERTADENAKYRAQVDAKAEALEERERKLNDRDNTHVRRDIRASLLKLTEDRLNKFGVSGTTQAQYYLVHAVSVIGVVGLVLGALYFGGLVAPDAATGGSSTMKDGLQVAMVVKSALLFVAAVSLGAWYLRWLNRWLQRIADAEFKLQQFRLDIERASWLAETVLEWRSRPDAGPFPEVLASRLSAGLFHQSASETDDPTTPAQHLANALLGAAAGVRIKAGDNEIMIDRKGVKALNTDA